MSIKAIAPLAGIPLWLICSAIAVAQTPSTPAIPRLPGDHGKGSSNGIYPDAAHRAQMPKAPLVKGTAPAAPPIDLAMEAIQVIAATCKQYPMGAAVVNSKGEPILVYVPDGSSTTHAFGSIRKAYSAIIFGAPTSTMVTKAQTDPAVAARVTADPNLMAYSGGVPLTTADGRVIGAIGVSGAEPGGHDEECALAGAHRIADRLK